MSECNCEIPLYYCTDRPDCKMVARIKSKTPGEVDTLRAKLAAAEARAERLAGSVDIVLRRFTDAENAGYRTADRQFAIDILGKALAEGEAG